MAYSLFPSPSRRTIISLASQLVPINSLVPTQHTPDCPITVLVGIWGIEIIIQSIEWPEKKLKGKYKKHIYLKGSKEKMLAHA